MKKVIRLNENDIEKLVKKIVKETKMINELDLGDFKVLKSSEMCNLSDGYKVGVADLRGKEILVLLDGKNNVAAHGPMMDFFEGKNKKAVCYVAEQLKDELIMEEDYMDDYEANTYMFWQNIETIKEAAEHILSMDKDKVNEILADGHAWALDHIATSADDVEEVYHFLENREDDYEGNMKKEYGTYNESVKGRIIHSDEFGFTELLPMNEDGGKGACANRGLSKPWSTPDGPKKRSVCVKNGDGNVVKVNFGDPNMRIKKSNPERRKSFRARHKCDNPGPRWRARYWSCKFW